MNNDRDAGTNMMQKVANGTSKNVGTIEKLNDKEINTLLMHTN